MAEQLKKALALAVLILAFLSLVIILILTLSDHKSIEFLSGFLKEEHKQKCSFCGATRAFMAIKSGNWDLAQQIWHPLFYYFWGYGLFLTFALLLLFKQFRKN
jgi:hypothetical protein